MIEQVANFMAYGGEFIVAFEDQGAEKFLILAIIDDDDGIKAEVVLTFAEAEELFSVLLDFLTEG